MTPLTTEEVSTDFRIGRRVSQVDKGLRDQERRKLIMNVLGELRSDMREIIILRDVQGMSYEKIAEITGCTVGTVKSRVSRARMKFKDIYVRHFSGQRSG